MDAMLSELYASHLGRFGDWALAVSQSGSWKLALDVAEREKPAGEPAALDALAFLFWWDGSLAFMRKLQSDQPAFTRALDRIARVVDYDDTLVCGYPNPHGQRRLSLPAH